MWMVLAALALLCGVGVAMAALVVLTGDPREGVAQVDLPVEVVDQPEVSSVPEAEPSGAEASAPRHRPAPSTTASPTAAVEASRQGDPGVVKVMASTSVADRSGTEQIEPVSAPTSQVPEPLLLEDAAEIDAMVASVLAAEDASLRQCYESRLEEREDLMGAWRIALTVGTSGQPQGVSIRPLGMSDEELEICLEHNVSNWRFQQIAEDVAVVKSYRFGPGF